MLVVVAGLAGCKKALDRSKIESEIKPALGAQIGVAIETLNCPDLHSVKKGDSFTCAATASGVAFNCDVTQISDDGQIAIKTKGIVILSMVSKSVGDSLTAQTKLAITVDCGTSEHADVAVLSARAGWIKTSGDDHRDR